MVPYCSPGPYRTLVCCRIVETSVRSNPNVACDGTDTIGCQQIGWVSEPRPAAARHARGLFSFQYKKGSISIQDIIIYHYIWNLRSTLPPTRLCVPITYVEPRCITRPTNYTIVQSKLSQTHARSASATVLDREVEPPKVEPRSRAWRATGHGMDRPLVGPLSRPCRFTQEPRKPPTTRARSRRPPSCLAQSVSLGR